MTIITLSIDLAKNVFHVPGADRRDRVMLRKMLTRKRLAQFVSDLPPCVIGTEACGGAHYWAREFESMGHTVRLMHPKFVRLVFRNPEVSAAIPASGPIRPSHPS